MIVLSLTIILSLTNVLTKIGTPIKKVKYPENLPLKQMVLDSGRSVRHLAKKIGVSTGVLSQTIHGHYKGINIVPRLKRELGIE